LRSAWHCYAAAASSPAFKTNWIRANGVSLRYELSGKGPSTIVLLHEASMGLESWDYVAPELAKTHQVLRYDMRGYGLSQAIRGPITLADHENDLRELLKVLNLNGKVNVIGTAVGGAVASVRRRQSGSGCAGDGHQPGRYLQGEYAGTRRRGAGSPPGAAPGGPGRRSGVVLPGALQVARPLTWKRPMRRVSDSLSEADPVPISGSGVEGSSAGSAVKATMGATSSKYAGCCYH
jgi:hypothetical protein